MYFFFLQIEGLAQLHLAGNNLKDFTFDDNCLLSLRMLDLSNNKIASPSVRILTGIPSLQALDISGNPLHCDCEIATFIAKMVPQRALNQVCEKILLFFFY